jgi:hypothetical protein
MVNPWRRRSVTASTDFPEHWPPAHLHSLQDKPPTLLLRQSRRSERAGVDRERRFGHAHHHAEPRLIFAVGHFDRIIVFNPEL